MRVLFDTNIVLDVLLNRQPWVVEASQLWQANDEGKFEAHITATTLTNIFYIARRQTNLQRAYQAVDICLQTFAICPVDQQTLVYARTLAGDDFEDNLQISCAVLSQVHVIVTRDPTGFTSSAVAVYAPSQLLQIIKE